MPQPKGLREPRGVSGEISSRGIAKPHAVIELVEDVRWLETRGFTSGLRLRLIVCAGLGPMQKIWQV